MRFLAVLCLLGAIGVGYVLFLLYQQLRLLKKAADQTEGFHLRRPSLSPAEWRRWNSEFWTFRILKFPLTLLLAEGLLLGLAFKQAHVLPLLLLFAAAFQTLPLLFIYLLQLFLFYRYGRFNLQRFDPAGAISREQARVVIIMSAWLPPVATWLYFTIFDFS